MSKFVILFIIIIIIIIVFSMIGSILVSVWSPCLSVICSLFLVVAQRQKRIIVILPISSGQVKNATLPIVYSLKIFLRLLNEYINIDINIDNGLGLQNNKLKFLEKTKICFKKCLKCIYH